MRIREPERNVFSYLEFQINSAAHNHLMNKLWISPFDNEDVESKRYARRISCESLHCKHNNIFAAQYRISLVAVCSLSIVF